MTCTVVNLCKYPYDVYIGRAGKGQAGYFGNPFDIISNGGRERCLAAYREYFHNRLAADPDFRQQCLALAGKRLGCFCKPLACHGDVIAEWVNEQTAPKQGELF